MALSIYVLPPPSTLGQLTGHRPQLPTLLCFGHHETLLEWYHGGLLMSPAISQSSVLSPKGTLWLEHHSLSDWKQWLYWGSRRSPAAGPKLLGALRSCPRSYRDSCSCGEVGDFGSDRKKAEVQHETLFFQHQTIIDLKQQKKKNIKKEKNKKPHKQNHKKTISVSLFFWNSRICVWFPVSSPGLPNTGKTSAWGS